MNVEASTPQRPKWLLQFKKPGFHEMRALEAILRDMPPHTPKRSLSPRSVREAALVGTLHDVMDRLADVLQDDYALNFARRDTKRTFEYVVTDAGPDEGAVEIWTRLFHPHDAKTGNIFYGRTVRRISADKYRLWVDD
jgi:hypothetical protein